jgi:trimethylamine--corrinoid protein Co-methyltransferase
MGKGGSLRARALKLTRQPLFQPSELEAIEEAALRILEEVGVEVSHPELAARAASEGFEFSQTRIRLARRKVAEFLAEARGGARGQQSSATSDDGCRDLVAYISPYPQSVHDPETDEIVPFTAARLAEATKLVGAVADRGIVPQVPGCPVDVPAPLQVILQYRIAAENLPGGGPPVDPKALASMPYIMEMAEVLGRPIRSLPVYVFSPLTLAGESLSGVMAYESGLDAVGVSSMPAAGSTAPVRPSEALALAAAEVIGSALILRECIEPPVHWGIGAYPFDMRGMAMSFGSPEALLFEMASCEVDAYFHGHPWHPAVGNIHTLAKLPGPQAAAEKATLMTLGALWGATEFHCAGVLSLDEIFSPVQLLADLEVKDHVQRLVRGLETGCDADALVADVREGLEGGFMGIERTLDRYRELYWHPQLFERRFLGPWRSASSPSFGQLAREMCRELLGRYCYEPPAGIRSEIERIYRRAERGLAAAT